jgi:ribosomal protein S12 methylthiotransferase
VRGREGNGWIRLMYAYPSCFTDEMISTLAECEHVVKYIDMPLQHINDDVLFAMRRKVTRKQTETLLEKLRKWVPGMTLRTTLISGFPGETEAQHQELLQFVKDFEFDCLGVFEYSPEPGTPAGRLWEKEKIPAQDVARRKEEIMLAQQAVVLKKNGALVGRKISVLVDEINPRKKSAVARHTGQAPDIDGRVLIENATARPGDLVQVRVDDFNYYDLIATETSPVKTTKKRDTRPLSLPVVGAVHGGVETRGKRG